MCIRVLLLCFVALAARGATDAALQPKPAWQWTDEERIAVRLDPAAIVARARVYQKRAQAVGGNAATTDRSTFAPPAFIIDGSVDPELFMPWELMERFLNSTDPDVPHVEIIRSRYVDDIAAAGWSTTTFWIDLDVIAAEFRAVRRQAANEFRAGSDQRLTRRRYDSITTDSLYRAFCSARVAALARAEERFGQAQIRRFLYEVVAPTVTVVADDPMTAAQLRRIGHGCS